jgi:hypothetical protein
VYMFLISFRFLLQYFSISYPDVAGMETNSWKEA